MMFRRIGASLGVLALATGCTGLSDRIGKDVAQTEGTVSTLVRDVGRTAPGVVAPSVPAVVHEPGIWLGKTVVKLGQPTLPSKFYEPTTFDRSVHSLAELAERITLRAGIPTKVSVDALAVSEMVTQTGHAGNGSSTRGRTIAPPRAGAATPLPPGVPGATSAPSAPISIGQHGRNNDGVRITYSNGNLKGLLDTAAARFSVYWKYVDGTIHFFHTDSRTFQISAIPGDSTLTANVTSGSTSNGGAAGGVGGAGGAGATGGGDSGGGVNATNSQKTSVASQLSVFSSIEKSVTALLSSHGKVVASPATGSITVVDTPDTLDRIAALIDSENKALSRQVVINVTVLSVNVADNDAYGINWNAVYEGLRERYGIRNLIATGTGGTGFSAGILEQSSSRLAGSSLLINALSEQGKVRRQTTASVVTLNNQPVPVQVARQTSYLQSSQTTITALVGSTTTLVPGVVTSGFNMSILPHILTNGTVMLQFSTDISALRGLTTVSSNNSVIQTPEIDTRNFMQRVAMKSNETLIISGFEQTDDNLGEQGVGVAQNFALGGGYRAQASKEVIVILITPTMMSGS